jgi:hypothetical protein
MKAIARAFINGQAAGSWTQALNWARYDDRILSVTGKVFVVRRGGNEV